VKFSLLLRTHNLTAPFGKKEIDDVTLNLPNDKAPRADGFNVFFEKGLAYYQRGHLCTLF